MSSGPGFSVVELLTVITIIGLVIAITLPALQGARDAGRRSATQGLLNNLANAASTFQNDNNGRMPGLFASHLLGLDENGGGATASATNIAGLSATENLILGLAGGGGAVVTRAGFDSLAASEQQAYGPVYFTTSLDGGERYVNPALLGSDDGAYFKPPNQFFVAQTTSTGGDRGTQVTDESSGLIHAQAVPPDQSATPLADRIQIPDLVDAWGQPILTWVEDEARVPRVTDTERFAQISSGSVTGGSVASTPARFYWNSNAAFLRSQSFGRAGIDMTNGLDSRDDVSLIGEGVITQNTDNAADLLAALLGDPAYPDEQTLFGADGYRDTFPLRGRGSLILQSAGNDRIPFSARDTAIARTVPSGALSLGGSAAIDLTYGIQFFEGPAGNRRQDDDGSPTSIDFAGRFDDIIISNN